MSIFKEEPEYKRVIFNIEIDIANRLEKAKKDARKYNKKLDIESVINKELDKFLKKAEKRLKEMKGKKIPENPTTDESEPEENKTIDEDD